MSALLVTSMWQTIFCAFQSNETPRNIHFLEGLGTKTYFAQISAIGRLVDSFFAVVWQFSLPSWTGTVGRVGISGEDNPSFSLTRLLI